jgi:hypothetical protein
MRFLPITNAATCFLRPSGFHARLSARDGSITVLDEHTWNPRIRFAPNHGISRLQLFVPSWRTAVRDTFNGMRTRDKEIARALTREGATCPRGTGKRAIQLLVPGR